ncbi:hypothetical protein G6011_11176 [Alternaria panax]|uniref:Uncharacterized protein n=1 Tax=Alternaria panax TaxID=48097 RepID=A0AAD4NRD1_9PLEO|nr:hypothetical protein G6011_11176 [Alternaria panax]
MPTHLAHPSPKRKRDQPAPIPLLNTALALRPAPSSGADSPRNAVADQLRGMTLAALAAIPMSPLTPTDDAIRKKPKLDAMRADSGAGSETHTISEASNSCRNGNHRHTIAPTPEGDASRVIPETPQSSQPRLLPDIASFAQTTSFVSSPVTTKLQPSASTKHRPSAQNPSSSQPRPRARSPSPPTSALTWRDSEITGHLVDPSTDPDDDGTGLNGIGFRPTPALAYARSQKRRQQLTEWKLRETREARAKRSERRKRGVRDTPSREVTVEREILPVTKIETTKRTVKFAI